MTTKPAFDHIALNVADLAGVVERLTSAFGMVAEFQTEQFALVADPGTGLKFELGRSGDGATHFRHFGFATKDLAASHETLVQEGLAVSEPPHRRDFARMHTSFLKEPGGVEFQLCQYD